MLNKILFIERYRNGSWGSKDEGKFVTSDGNVYQFNLVSKSKKYNHPSTDEFMQNLTDISRKESPSQTIDKKVIQDAYSLVNKIDKTSKMIKIHTACDAGQRSLLIYYERMLIPLATSGDNTGFIDSNVVDKILEILEKNKFYTLGLFVKMTTKEIRENYSKETCPSPFGFF